MPQGPRLKLTPEEIRAAFPPEASAAFPPILDVPRAAALCCVSRKTLYRWIALGRLDGAFRKRGGRHLIWRDRLVALIFDNPTWRD